MREPMPALPARLRSVAGAEKLRHCWLRLVDELGAAEDIAALAALRVLFGALMVAASVRFVAQGWVARFFIEPTYHFTYPGLDFIRPWPGYGMYVHYACLGLFALGIALGYRYRLCCVGFLLAFAYAELIDQSLYLNHYYLISLLAALLCVLPAHAAGSVDVLRRPELRASSVPRGVLWALRLQVGVVYVFAGLGKLNHDWLVDGQPLRIWFAARSDWPFIGAALSWPEAARAASWAGAAFDLGIVAALLNRRTRTVAWFALLGFHALTGILFPIGMFPWVMSAAATVLLPASWPRRLATLLGLARRRSAAAACRPTRPDAKVWSAPHWLPPLLVAHCLIQVLVPLRQHLTSDSAWTAQGFNFAWKVMLVEKVGSVSFRVRDRVSGAIQRVEPRSFLAPFQVAAMATDPALIRKAALHLAAEQRARGRDVAVYADSTASLNGHPGRPLVDRELDLTGRLAARWSCPGDGERPRPGGCRGVGGPALQAVQEREQRLPVGGW